MNELQEEEEKLRKIINIVRPTTLPELIEPQVDENITKVEQLPKVNSNISNTSQVPVKPEILNEKKKKLRKLFCLMSLKKLKKSLIKKKKQKVSKK